MKSLSKMEKSQRVFLIWQHSQNTEPNHLTQNSTFRDSDLFPFFEDGTKLKIPSENMYPTFMEIHTIIIASDSRYEHFLGTIGGLFQLLIGTNPQSSQYIPPGLVSLEKS